jgi:hypothetical protein
VSGLRPLLATGLLALSVALVPVATGGWTAVPAPPWLAGLVAVLAVVALWRQGPPRASHDLPVAIAFGLAAAQAHLAPGMVLGHDVVDHAWGAWAYLQAWHAGDLGPLWLHQLGLGQPMPVFYGPLPFWAMAPFAAAGGATSAMISGSFVLASVVASGVAWLAVGRWTGDRRGALVAALAMAYAPYRLLDANYRVGLGESWSIALLPLALYAYARGLESGFTPRRFALVATATALITLAHPLSLALLVVAVALLAAAHWTTALRSDPRAALARIARAAAAGAAGVALAAFFLLPLASGLRHLRLGSVVDDSGRARYASHGLHPIEIVERRLWDRLLFSLPETPDEEPLDPELPSYVGLVLVGCLAAAALGGAGSDERRSTLAMLGRFGLASLALSLVVVARWTSAVPGISILQFPWRFLGPATAAAALAAGLLASAPPFSRMRGAVLPIALALALIGDGFSYSGAVVRVPPWQDLTLVSRFSWGARKHVEVPPPWPLRVAGQFLPPNRCCADVGLILEPYREYYTPASRELAMHAGRAGAGLRGLLGAVPQALVALDAAPYARRETPTSSEPLAFVRGGGAVEVRLPDAEGGTIVVAEQYFPGWQVDNGTEWVAAGVTADGQLAGEVPAGRSIARFRFRRWTLERTIGWSVSVLAAAALAVSLRRRRSSESAAEAAPVR